MRKGQQVAAEIARLRLQTAATQRSVALAEDEARRLRRQTTQRLERQRSAEEANERLPLGLEKRLRWTWSGDILLHILHKN